MRWHDWLFKFVFPLLAGYGIASLIKDWTMTCVCK